MARSGESSGNANGHPDAIDLTGDDEVDAIMTDLVQIAKATRGVRGQEGEW